MKLKLRLLPASLRATLTVGVALVVAVVGVAAAAANDQGPPFRSWTAMRMRNVVPQRLDFSCGAAALATLSTYFLGNPLNEEQALRIIRARYPAEEWKKRKKEGLSMEDLVFTAEQLGYKAEGARIGLSGLVKLSGPVIVHLDKGEFQHFSVLRGISGMTVFLADSITGTAPMSLGLFLEQFTGVALAVWDNKNPLPPDHALILREKDKFYDDALNIFRPTLAGGDRVRGVRPAL